MTKRKPTATIEGQIQGLEQRMQRGFGGVGTRIADLEAVVRTLREDFEQLSHQHIQLEGAVHDLKEIVTVLRGMTAAVGQAARVVEYIERQRTVSRRKR